MQIIYITTICKCFLWILPFDRDFGCHAFHFNAIFRGGTVKKLPCFLCSNSLFTFLNINMKSKYNVVLKAESLNGCRLLQGWKPGRSYSMTLAEMRALFPLSCSFGIPFQYSISWGWFSIFTSGVKFPSSGSKGSWDRKDSWISLCCLKLAEMLGNPQKI